MRRCRGIWMGLFAIIWLVGCTAQTAQAPLQPTPEPTRTTDRPTKLHFQGAVQRIDNILDPQG